jgi:DNA (cytosine-5)-methyltransferase 1
MIPVIDLFAGPGGLGEGFSAFHRGQNTPFRVALSIEKDPIAHETLKLRSFFRQFSTRNVPEEYYDHLRGKLSSKELYDRFPLEAAAADHAAWNAELGNYDEFPAEKIDQRIRASLNGAKDWVLIGGPPCQAYSTVGRSRVIPVDPKRYAKDERHFLYKAYLRIIVEHRPPVFVLENVTGILSAEVRGTPIIDRLLSDLRHPVPAAQNGEHGKNNGLEYTIFPLADYSRTQRFWDEGSEASPADYIIRCEQHRIPQARHRFILLGVRSDITQRPQTLRLASKPVKMWQVIGDLPKLRSKLSQCEDSGTNWVTAIRRLQDCKAMCDEAIDDLVLTKIVAKLEKLSEHLPTGAAFLPHHQQPRYRPDWYSDRRLGGICNHVTRRHMESDLWRYFFLACYTAVHKRSPKLASFPSSLLPDHTNVKNSGADEFIFKDRFRVQVKGQPSATVTCHIAKDGHYFIHPDPLQCRSLTVREAARLQTFPDNYFFAGPTTAQYQQVGNAVPPLLATQIARIVCGLLSKRTSR